MTVAVLGAIERLEPDPDGGWRITLDDGSVRGFQAVVVAIGLFWSPKLPDGAAGFAGEVSHSHDYRTPAPVPARRLLRSDLRRARRATGSTLHRWRQAEELASGRRR